MNTLSELAGDQHSGDKSRTFIFNDENHTLGNCLVSIITEYEDVVFCGYTVPHPAEHKMHLRIQTSGPPAIAVLQRGLQDLEKSEDVVFCGYTVPHPAEHKMHLRIQTNGPPAIAVLQRGLRDLEKRCDDVSNKFKAAMSDYMNKELEDVD